MPRFRSKTPKPPAACANSRTSDERRKYASRARERLGDVVALRGERYAMLVRPDGHLAWRGTDGAGLQAWLDAALGPRVEVLTP